MQTVLEGGCTEAEAAEAISTLEELAASGMPEAMMALAGLYKSGRFSCSPAKEGKVSIYKTMKICII